MRGAFSIWLAVLTAWGVGTMFPSAGAAVSVQASLERDTLMTGESGKILVSIEGGTPQTAENFPPVPGLAIQYQGNQQQFSSVNGRSTFKHILTYAVTAAQPGQYQIPPIHVVVDGTSYATPPLSLTVTKSDVNAQNREAFLRLLVPKKELYVGEVIPIEVQLYVTDAENLQAPQLNSDGFVIHKQAQHTRGQTQIGQQIYNVISFKMSVSAAKAGKLTLGPAEMSFVLNIRLRRDPNDLFGFFGRVQRRQMTVASPGVEINVLPLPPNAPPEFSGAIGSFQWKVEAAPTTVNAGDPITLRAAISGKGNLDNLKLPEFKWLGFKLYEPTSSTESADPLGLEGTKTFEQVIIPQSPSVTEVPALGLAYFDPAQKGYVKLAQPAMPITVRASAAAPAVPTVARTEEQGEAEPPQRTDIVHIKMDPGPVLAVTTPLIYRPWFLAVAVLPLLGFAGVSLWRKRQDELANNPRLRRRLQTRKTIESGLVELRQIAQAGEADAFYALTFRLLQEQLGEQLDLPASAITEAAVDERLLGPEASPELIEQLHTLFRICNQARYAPVRSHTELLAVAGNLQSALQQLQALPG